MNNLDWCKETIPELFTLNKMISARKGNIPVKVIYLAGEEKCVAFVIEQEQELFAGLTIVTKSQTLNLMLQSKCQITSF